MRPLIVSNIMTLDGYYEGPGGNPMVLNMDAAFDQYNLERIQHAATVLLGRRSFEMFSSYWPGIADAPSDPENQQLSETNRAFSRRYNQLPKAVVSDTYTVPDDNPWRAQTTVIQSADIAGWVRDTQAEGEGDIVVFGSRHTWTGLHDRGLVDEVHLMVGPAAVGGGTPLFSSPTRLDLLEARQFKGSANVVLRYATTPRR